MHGDQFVVAYIKIQENDFGPTSEGIYFGGVADTIEEADKIARECVNTIRGGTIIPKVVPLIGEHALVEALFAAADKFDQITAHMSEAGEIIKRR